MTFIATSSLMFIINNFFNDGTQAPDLANYVFTTRAIKQIKIKILFHSCTGRWYGAPFSHLFTELKISPIEVHISAIELEISPIQLKISAIELQISPNRPI